MCGGGGVRTGGVRSGQVRVDVFEELKILCKMQNSRGSSWGRRRGGPVWVIGGGGVVGEVGYGGCKPRIEGFVKCT